jgi:hypothetical protein
MVSLNSEAAQCASEGSKFLTGAVQLSGLPFDLANRRQVISALHVGVVVVQCSRVYYIQSKARDFSERSGGVKAIISPQYSSLNCTKHFRTVFMAVNEL